MINDRAGTKKPFLMRFREEMPPPPDLNVHYDPERQVIKVWAEGGWQDMADYRGRGPWQATLVTKTDRETTDDR